jgi:hypothetical protein
MSVSRPNNVINQGNPAAGITYGSPLTSPLTRNAARSMRDWSKTLLSSRRNEAF